MNTTVHAVQSFCFESNKVRTIVDEHGEHWLVTTDICKVLQITNVGNATSRIPDLHKGIRSMDTLGGKQKVSVIDESGMYRLVLRSDKPQAEPFIEWVTSEVLPAIRRTGRYESPSAPAPSPNYAHPVQSAQPSQPTHLSFNYRESTVEVVLDSNRDPHFNVDDVFAALGYANKHGSHQWLRIHAANLRTFPAGLDSQGVDHKYFPLELLYQFLRHSGKIEKFRFIRWLEERVLPDLPKVDFTRPAGLLENLVPVHERTPGACYLLTFDGQQQPSITRLASRENASVTFYDTPGKPNFLTTAYYPIDLMLERVRMDAMASGPDRKSVCVSGLA